MAQCEMCARWFPNARQLGPHKRVCTRQLGPVITEPVEPDQAGPPMGTAVPIARSATDLARLAQRPTSTQWDGDSDPRNLIARPAPAGESYRDVRELQSMWKEYVKIVHSCCSIQFWQTLQTVAKETCKTRDNVLSVVKKLLQCPRRWPASTRALGKVVRNKAGNFWPNVTESHVIDLSEYGLASCKSVTFSFADPIFVWTQCCNALHSSGHRLHWDPKSLIDPRTQQPAYGAGIQHGLLFHSAAASIPAGGKPAMISMSWDGGNTGYGHRSTTPICIQVMNVNSASQTGVGLLGYMPHVQVADALKQTRAAILARSHVQQVKPTERAQTCTEHTCFVSCIYANFITHMLYVHICHNLEMCWTVTSIHRGMRSGRIFVYNW